MRRATDEVEARVLDRRKQALRDPRRHVRRARRELLRPLDHGRGNVDAVRPHDPRRERHEEPADPDAM